MTLENERGIYKILNTLDGKCYVGSTKDAFWRRWKNHRKTLAAGCHHSIKLQRAYEKYGADAFDYVIVEIVKDEKLLISREQFWIDRLDCVERGYNVAPKARSSLGVKWTAESRQKMVAIRSANPISPGQHERMAEGRRQSEKYAEALKKIHEGCRGRKLSEAHKTAIGAASKVRWQDPKYKANHSAKMTGFKHTDEARGKISKSRTGMTFTEEHKRNLSIAHLGYEPTAEARKNMSAAQQRRRERERSGRAA